MVMAMKSPVTFIHSADWQLGMARAYLSDEAQARFTGDRVGTIRTIGELAKKEDAQFIVVAGDVFEHASLPPRDIWRAFEAMSEVSLPIFLLPGNHDPLGPGSIWTGKDTLSSKPDNVTILDREGLFDAVPGVEIIAAPWYSKHPGRDPITGVLDSLEPTEKTRILVAHGMLDILDPDRESLTRVDTEALRAAVTNGLIDYAALGDRHICWIDDVTGAVNYSGTHETTSPREQTRGTVLSVTLDNGTVETARHEVGIWLHRDIKRHISSMADIDLLKADLSEITQKDCAIIRTGLTGTLSMAAGAALDQLIEDQQQIFASLYPWDRHTDIVIIPDDDDEDALGLSGFAADALAELRDLAREGDATASNALKLLYRLGAAA